MSLSLAVITRAKFLNDREKQILTERFGVGGSPPKTLTEVGASLTNFRKGGGKGVTRERVRQLQNIALSKVKRHLGVTL